MAFDCLLSGGWGWAGQMVHEIFGQPICQSTIEVVQTVVKVLEVKWQWVFLLDPTVAARLSRDTERDIPFLSVSIAYQPGTDLSPMNI